MTECAVRSHGPETCATLSMQGPFDQIPRALGKVYGWLLQAEGHTPQGMPLTVYLNDPAAVDPADALEQERAPIEAAAEEQRPDAQGLAIRRIIAMTVATRCTRSVRRGGGRLPAPHGVDREVGVRASGPSDGRPTSTTPMTCCRMSTWKRS